MSPIDAVAVASIEGDLKAQVAQLQKTVRSQQATIDEQEDRLRNVEILVARMRQSLGIQVPAGACASASTLAAQGVGDVIACPDASSSQAVIACPRAEAHCGAERPEGEFVRCNLCPVASTHVCLDASGDDSQRAGCLKMQGWTKSKSTKRWRCPKCTQRECYAPDQPPEPWPDACWLRHGRYRCTSTAWSASTSEPSAQVASTNDPWQ